MLGAWQIFFSSSNFCIASYKSQLFFFRFILHHFQAKDTPEPEFDLSDCNLKDVPSGVFVLCRILLKERLDLHNNQLQSLNGGGALNDLSNLTQINLSFNRFTRVPDEFCNTLKNLRVSFTRCFFFTRPVLVRRRVLQSEPSAIYALEPLENTNIHQY